MTLSSAIRLTAHTSGCMTKATGVVVVDTVAAAVVVGGVIGLGHALAAGELEHLSTLTLQKPQPNPLFGFMYSFNW